MLTGPYPSSADPQGDLTTRPTAPDDSIATDSVAATLSRLHPASPCAGLQQIWYRAGLEAGHRRVVAWRTATAASILIAAATAWVTGTKRGPAQPSPAVVERIVYVERPAAPAAQHPEARRVAAGRTGDAISYARLRDAVAQRGLDALPPSSASGRGRDLRWDEGAWPTGVADDPYRPRLHNRTNEKG